VKILILHQHFHPETVGTSTRAVEIVEYLVEQGHDVTVITGIPSHPSTMRNGEVSRKQPRRENFRGAKIHRVWTYGSSKPDVFSRRMMAYSSFMVVGGLKALFIPGSYDSLVAISPLPNGVAGLIVSKLRNIPLMFDVCDIWPDCAVAVGMMKPSLILRVAQWLEKKVYHASTRIGVVTRGFTGNIVAKGIPEEKIRLLPDWVDPELYDPVQIDRNEARQRYDLDNHFVVSFLGNFGLLMGLEAILETARLVQERDSSVLFLFVGKGAALPMMEEKIKKDDLRNVRIIPYRPREEVPAMLQASDVLIVTYMKSELTMITVPSKIYEYLSIARPIVAGVTGVVAEILTDANAALISPTRDPAEMADHILTLKDDPQRGDAMGASGRQYAINHFSFAKVAEDYERAVEETAQHGQE
jgi:glycosyltransferase involved in cell wall biosynthesis